ncbi:type II toxin-antitoxin system VapC family toxin [candidate division KSB1 bacterium]|nr:type II toxin-antitoxin system VapC family toxin [candidate division KSB1 bacterium]NIR72552.1 type II toxin-antitoxin system VapC family toxin [candidate division KSB1 bacterium]NIS27304.1 type II toxin-antitoxin system VapC family toxin [candidate division KSB1 bacterium]NIT73514.1 type II toxin-antitoxin system VapC family toxin [candidate division KSB1 bacterium]NIU28034.1 type II toxin-antitoxin system VapC family toxin [candidate division KSB1 bacterium]
MASNNYIVDTHTLYWYLANDDRLGKVAKQVFENATSGRAKIFIPSIVMAEIYWILEKQGKTDVFMHLFDTIEDAEQFEFVDLRAADVLDFKSLTEIPRCMTE